jgi:alpha-L-fucosidase
MPEPKDRTEWFAGKWGVLFHYLASPAGSVDGGTPAEEWNRQVDAFDVRGLVAQLRSVGADYFAVTLGQGSGHYLSPNETYERLTDLPDSKLSRRDLVAELGDALDGEGMRLMVYVSGCCGWADLRARLKLGMSSHHNDHRLGLRKGANDWAANRRGQVAFLKNWQEFHREWSVRWGKKVSAWWVDGCYQPAIRFPQDEPPNLASMAAALRAGNPDALIAFNTGGTRRPFSGFSVDEDYTAGEVSNTMPACRGAWVQEGEHRVRFHMLSYLGSTWGKGEEPRFEDARVVDLTRDILAKGGFVSWDVPPLASGLIAESFMPQLMALGDAAKEARE